MLDRQGHKLHQYLKRSILPFSPHYRAVFKEAGLTADDIRSVDDLTKIPFTNKADLLPTAEQPRKHLDYCLTPDPEVLRRRFDVILRGLRHGAKQVKAELDREWRPVFMTSTTGRSSAPVPFLYTQYDLANLGRVSAHWHSMLGGRPDDRILNLFPYAPHLAFWLGHYSSLQNNVFSLGTGGGKVMGTDGNIRLITGLKPAFLAGMPTFIYHILQQAVAENLRWTGIRVLIVGGEKVPDGLRLKLIQLLEQLGSPGAKVVSNYGFTEAKLAWTECPSEVYNQTAGFHLVPDMAIIEVVDPKTGKPVPPETGGEIVFTPLDSRGTVVIRYRTGDFIEHGLHHGVCPACGYKHPRLVGRISRVSEFRSMRFQKVKGSILDFNELESLLDGMAELGAWQVELRKRHDDPHEVDELHLHVCRRADVDEEGLAERLRREFGSHFEVRPNVITFHTPEQMRQLHGVGVAMKEEKIVDRRPKDSPQPASV